MVATLVSATSHSQTTSLVAPAMYQAIRDEASGELPLVDFRNISNRFAGFTPSKGGDQIAEYIAGRAREHGLSDVSIEGFPSDGKTWYWAFVGEPSWDAEAGTLSMVKPRGELLADFNVDRAVLGRYSTSADVTTELVDVGDGTAAADYAGKDVKGKIVLITGQAELAHAQAVWDRGAAGVVIFRPAAGGEGGLAGNPALGNRTGGPAVVPWRSPTGQTPAFVFSVSSASGVMLRQMLARGERVTLHARVKATIGAGEYKQVTAIIKGTDPSAKEVWIKGHDNYRNSGGLNNLSGVGAVIEVARVLNTLITGGTLPRPTRTIRFVWSAEHFGDIMTMHTHPELRQRVLSFFSVDMIGFNQEKVKAVPRLTRMPYSMPHFLSDVSEEFFRAVGDSNMNSQRNSTAGSMANAFFAPTGSRDEMRYTVEEFWGPSDHEDMVEASIGVPSVEYGHPAHFATPQDDNVTSLDPTQMRRGVTIVATTAYYLASVRAAGVPVLAAVVTANAQARMARDGRRAFDMLGGSDLAVGYREGLNVLKQALAREVRTVETLRELGESPGATGAAARARRQLEGLHAANDAAFRERAMQLAAERKIELRDPALADDERRLDGVVVRRNESICGPVNLFRPEYGAIWLAQKVHDPAFAAKLRIAGLGRFTGFEALNFVDGRRTLLDIRDLVSAEYGPIEPAVIEEYFRFLADVGVVSLSSTGSAGR
jgi:aminopeptidase YwaD